MKATINSSKFCSSKFLTCLIRQILSDFSTVKICVIQYCIFYADITLHPQSKTIATGQTIVLNCTVTVYGTGTDNLTYWWSKNGGKPFVVNSSNLLMISNATVDDNGMYNCIAFSASSNSTIKSNSANVTVLGESL